MGETRRYGFDVAGRPGVAGKEERSGLRAAVKYACGRVKYRMERFGCHPAAEVASRLTLTN